MIVVWRVLDDCNLACPFCAFDKRRASARRAIAPERVLRFLHVLHDYREATGREVLVSWLGGEPLLWEPLPDLTDAATELNLSVSATTNGTTLGSAKVRAHIISRYRELTISVDGLAPFHNDTRGWVGGFEKLSAWIPRLAQEARNSGGTLKLRANVVLMRGNVAAFPALCETLADWCVEEITFNQLGGRDRPEFYPQNRLRPEDVRVLADALSPLRARMAERGVALIGGDAYLDRFMASARGETRPVQDCGPGKAFLFIDEGGRVSPCSFTTDTYAINVDDIGHVETLRDLPTTFARMRAEKRSHACEDCLSTQQCEKFGAPRAGSRR